MSSRSSSLGPRPAYGYVWNDDKSRYLLDLETAPVVRQIFDWALDGVTLRGIATRLHERGIPSPTGQARWSLSALRGMLLRHVYTGDAVAYAKRVVRRPGGGYTYRAGTPEETVLVPKVAPPLVTREELAVVKDRLTTNKAHARRNNRDPEATLLRAGFAICGHCGSALAVANRGTSSRSPRYWCVERNRHAYDCPQPSIAAHLIDGPVWERVGEVLRDPRIIAREVARVRQEGGLDRDLAAIEKHLGNVSAKQGRTARAIAAIDDDAAAAPLLAELQSLAARKTALEQERDTVRARLADAQADAAKLSDLREWCQRVHQNLDSMTYEQKRLALDALGVTVRVFRAGTVDAEGNPNPKYEIAMRPVVIREHIVYTPARHG